MNSYIVKLQNAEDFSETAVLVKNATSVDHAEEKVEKVGLLENNAILSTVELSRVIE